MFGTLVPQALKQVTRIRLPTAKATPGIGAVILQELREVSLVSMVNSEPTRHQDQVFRGVLELVQVMVNEQGQLKEDGANTRLLSRSKTGAPVFLRALEV